MREKRKEKREKRKEKREERKEKEKRNEKILIIIYMNNFLPFNDIKVLETYIQSEQPLNIIDRSSDFTLFMFICDKILNTQPYQPWAKLAMKMLDLNAEQINLNYANRDGVTALILVSGVDVEVSLKIIEFGPEAINMNAIEKDNKMNALMYACTPDTEEIALALLNYPQIVTSLKNINNNGYTPLMIACEEGLEDVALTMLEKFPSANLHLFQRNRQEQTAFDIAVENEEMSSVYRLIGEYMDDEQINYNMEAEQEDDEEETKTEKVIPWGHKEMPNIPSFSEQIIDINGIGYDPFLLEERNIKEYLEEDKTDNIVILYEGKNYLLSKSTMERQMEDAIVFECIKADNTKNFPNIVYNLPLYNIKAVGVNIPDEKIGIWPEFIYLDGIKDVIGSQEKLFSIIPLVNQMLVSVMSLHESKKIGTGEGSGYGALHCQNGQGGMAAIIVPAKASSTGGRKRRTNKKKSKIMKKRKTVKKRRLQKQKNKKIKR